MENQSMDSKIIFKPIQYVRGGQSSQDVEKKEVDLDKLEQQLIKAIQAYVEGVTARKIDQTMKGILESAVKSENVAPHNS